jgi:membrane dipeptidase
MLIIDGHEDIAYNMIMFGRDYTHSAHYVRKAENRSPGGGTECTLGLADWLAGDVAIVFATLFAQPGGRFEDPWDVGYHTPQEAYAQAMEQLETYYRLVDTHPQFRLVLTQRDLDIVLASWRVSRNGHTPDPRQIGMVVLMEGADPIVEPEQIGFWHKRGLRIVGLAWEGTRYAGGTHEPGPLTRHGRRLLHFMRQLNMALDLSHCAEEAFFQALDIYEGPVIASHSNPRKFKNSPRSLSKAMIRRLAERGGIIGILPVNAMLKPAWKCKGKKCATIADVVAAIDYVCQLTGSASHAALGTDFDGGFGAQEIPAEIDTIADVRKIGDALLRHGYTPADVEAIMGGNWLRLLREILP